MHLLYSSSFCPGLPLLRPISPPFLLPSVGLPVFPLPEGVRLHSLQRLQEVIPPFHEHRLILFGDAALCPAREVPEELRPLRQNFPSRLARVERSLPRHGPLRHPGRVQHAQPVRARHLRQLRSERLVELAVGANDDVVEAHVLRRRDGRPVELNIVLDNRRAKEHAGVAQQRRGGELLPGVVDESEGRGLPLLGRVRVHPLAPLRPHRVPYLEVAGEHPVDGRLPGLDVFGLVGQDDDVDVAARGVADGAGQGGEVEGVVGVGEVHVLALDERQGAVACPAGAGLAPRVRLEQVKVRGMLRGEVAEELHGPVSGPVVHDEDLEPEAGSGQGRVHVPQDVREEVGDVLGGKDEGQVDVFLDLDVVATAQERQEPTEACARRRDADVHVEPSLDQLVVPVRLGPSQQPLELLRHLRRLLHLRDPAAGPHPVEVHPRHVRHGDLRTQCEILVPVALEDLAADAVDVRKVPAQPRRLVVLLPVLIPLLGLLLGRGQEADQVVAAAGVGGVVLVVIVRGIVLPRPQLHADGGGAAGVLLALPSGRTADGVPFRVGRAGLPLAVPPVMEEDAVDLGDARRVAHDEPVEGVVLVEVVSLRKSQSEPVDEAAAVQLPPRHRRDSEDSRMS
mmetsp:Transcript_14026/g.26475  ORF Transcript_14026/g.26475 Transcript_14026/m.26475 type:complete len:623 (+) Transcript_14026:2-1870(+)